MAWHPGKPDKLADIIVALGLVESLGIPFTMEPPLHPFYSWDGTQFWFSERDAEEICHDVAHWLMASETWRQLPEFGLGSSNWDEAKEPDEHLQPRINECHEEAMVSILGLILFSYLGGTDDYLKFQFHYQSWHDADPSKDLAEILPKCPIDVSVHAERICSLWNEWKRNWSFEKRY